MKLAFIAKHRTVWPVASMCAVLGVSRSGFRAWLTRQPSRRARDDEAILSKARASFVVSDRTDGARRVWRDVPADGRLYVAAVIDLFSRRGVGRSMRARQKSPPRVSGLIPIDAVRRHDVSTPNDFL